MGLALIAIRDKRLHRETHGNLEAYCWEKFHLDHADDLRTHAGGETSPACCPDCNQAPNADHRLWPDAPPGANARRSTCRPRSKLAAKKIEPDKDGNLYPHREDFGGSGSRSGRRRRSPGKA